MAKWLNLCKPTSHQGWNTKKETQMSHPLPPSKNTKIPACCLNASQSVLCYGWVQASRGILIQIPTRMAKNQWNHESVSPEFLVKSPSPSLPISTCSSLSSDPLDILLLFFVVWVDLVEVMVGSSAEIDRGGKTSRPASHWWLVETSKYGWYSFTMLYSH